MSARTHALWRAGARAAELLGGLPAPAPGLRVLAYHRVGAPDPRDPYGLAVPAAAFERQLDLAASGSLGSPADFGEADLGEPSARLALTFDDGYRDTLEAAAPALARRGLPFTVFVCPGLLDAGGPHLPWPRLRELAAVPGCRIGAHGLTHARLDSLGEEALAGELAGARRRLEDALGRPVDLLSWPHGACGRREARAAERAGYRRGACSLYGLNRPGRDPLLLKRVEVTGFDDERDFLGKALGLWDFFALRQGDPARR